MDNNHKKNKYINKKRIDVCLIAPMRSTKYKGGGVTRYTTELIHLAKEGDINFEVITYLYKHYLIDGDIKIHGIPFLNFGRYIRSLSFVFISSLYILTHYKKLPRLFSIQLGEFPFVFFISLLKMLNKNVVVTFHLTEGHMSITNKFLRKIFAIYLNKADKIIAVSRYSERILRNMGVKSSIRVVYNGVIIPRQVIKKEVNNKIVYFGRLSEEKGVFTLLDAALELPKLKFYIIGKGKLYQPIKKYIHTHKINNVKLLGYLNDAKLKSEILSAEIVVFPSIYEAFPIAILETMALAKPIITTKVGGIPEMIDYKSGILIHPNSKNELVSSIIKLHKNKQLRERLANNAFNKVKKMFNWKLLIHSIRDEYGKV